MNDETTSQSTNKDEDILVTIPVTKENLVIDTDFHVKGEVVITKSFRETEVDVPLPTVHTDYIEKRIAINNVIEQMPVIRHERNTMIIPVVREESVVVKRLKLIEEIHITKVVRKTEELVPVKLREDIISVDRK
jgi:stress response protein YsnF